MTSILGEDEVRSVVNERYDTKKDSVFKLPIKNTLGLDNMKSKAQLKTYALQYPVEYTKARSDAYSFVVEKMVSDNYEIIWNLLKNGKVDGVSIFKDNTNLNGWAPNLQDAEVAKIATGYAENILNLFDEIFEKIVPSDYKQLAENKATKLAQLELIK